MFISALHCVQALVAQYHNGNNQTDMKGVATVCPHMYVCEGCLPPPYSHASLIVSSMRMQLKCDYFYPFFLCLFIPFFVVGSLFSPSASSHSLSLSLSLQPPLQPRGSSLHCSHIPDLASGLTVLLNPPITHAVEGGHSL